MKRSRPYLRVAVLATWGFVFPALVAGRAHADDEASRTSALATWTPTVRVLIESSSKATLERDGSGPVCTSPCDVDVPLDGTYRIRLDGESGTSQPFELRTLPGWSRLTLKVDPSSRGAHAAGTAISVVGAIAVVAGVLVLGSAGSSSSYGNGLGPCSSEVRRPQAECSRSSPAP